MVSTLLLGIRRAMEKLGVSLNCSKLPWSSCAACGLKPANELSVPKKSGAVPPNCSVVQILEQSLSATFER